MRAFGSLWLILGLAAPLAAGAMGASPQASGPAYVPDNAVVTKPTYVSPAAALAPSNGPRDGGHGSGSGSGHSGGHDHGGWRHRGGVPFVYGSMYSAQGGNDGDGSDDDSDRQDKVRTEYVPVPYPVPVAAPAPPAPRRPPPIVRYATNGDPIEIPKGARVTTGSVYKYKQNGVSVYTDATPPASAHATLLFGYTEAVAPGPMPER